MTYHDQLHPWVVYRLLPNCQNQAIARFRRRNEASMYLATLLRLMPFTKFLIAFDPPQIPLTELMPIEGTGDRHSQEDNHACIE
jgi:hypothetical protein